MKSTAARLSDGGEHERRAERSAGAVIEAHEAEHQHEADERGADLAHEEVVDVVVGGEGDGEAGAVDEDQPDDDERQRGDEDGVVGPAGVQAARLRCVTARRFQLRCTRRRNSMPRCSKLS